MSYKTEQEEFWASDFGDDYINRNLVENIAPTRRNMFSKIISRTDNVTSIVEFGANIGSNLFAIHSLLPNCNLSAVEINSKAVQTLQTYDFVNAVYHGSFLDGIFDKKVDLSFTSGVLIHINPDRLNDAYQALYESSSRYIVVSEYYNPSPVSINYRGHQDRLFKRDFAGDLLDKYDDLKLVDYGFNYHRDPNFPDDDLTWFLLKKTS